MTTFREKNLEPQIQRGFVLAVSAPSGTGKTSLCDKLAEDYPFVVRSISLTTRPKRDGELSKRDYEFVSVEEFTNRRNKGELLESAEVFGNWYGTPKAPVMEALQAGKIIVMDIDTVGAFNVQRQLPGDSVLLFILPPSLKELEKRLQNRGKNSSEELKRRLSEAAREIEEAKKYDYVMTNASFDRAYEHFKSVIDVERMRPARLLLQ